ncbi:molybdopterin-guanine dinucleotide biosynthesis protein B [Campylobacter geochelonis]|uniref:Molybdopterin-guanine dinucleotide biosynthesis protein B n=1 Tax=Campylobacter geochelonis TaxID=1780362 RepID=A0A128EQW8_9BACT|nr:molybdopterin-guanine dinucleotide biosynthesis protein B [Campylobacter geochelonis]QKF71656.1 molybdenum cofactor guanylyltransferase protein B [Campylobacter geochelonis]CZE49286.1 molybdopterin-guanine dinucleotide biosynthesis protein B [Campylobacter geochelonis]CZE49400.1 molybdopterin-guanine dinucleotide biosynthesis protein B [Campylobacter geochelonis]CZE51486.1 molybdopterin-guanine dinucleotide biosynthesis protein B [Campylobacter geochelonis]
MKRVAIAFSGPSNTGKTTLILKVAKKFIDDGLKVVIIKHDPSDKAKFDVEGKDSYKFSQIGADVVVASPTRTTYFSKEMKSLAQMVDMVGEFDLLIVEGLKTLPLPRISLFREHIDESYLEFSDAIATDGLKCSVDIPNFDINDVESISKWVIDNAKKV